MSTAAIVVIFVILTFAPYRTIHPLRMPHMLIPNALALLAWAALGLYAFIARAVQSALTARQKPPTVAHQVFDRHDLRLPCTRS